MQLQVTKNTYKRANCELILSEDLKRAEAYGYDWFKYLHTDNVGNIILSEYSSVTSREHTRDILAVLKGHNLKPALTLDFVNEYSETEGRSIKAIHDHFYYGGNLTDINQAIKSEINLYKEHIRYLIEKIKAPRTHKNKNKDRKNEIKKCLYKIKDLRYFRDNILDKKQVKVTFKNNSFLGYRYSSVKLDALKVFNEVYNRYLKCSDTRQVKYYLKNFNVLQAQISHDHKGIELKLDKLCKLFNLNQNFDFTKIVFYRHIVDVERSIPSDIDSVEYSDFLKIVKRLKITKDNLNTLQLDRLHTSIINRALRAEKGPSVPKIWPKYQVPQKLIELETEINKQQKSDILTVIKDQGQLKKEGRQQKHCIGTDSMGYHRKILLQGYLALNFKGFTFFLDPDLNINQTYGKHNSSTPYDIRFELRELLSSLR
jgi:hypothetical protein